MKTNNTILVTGQLAVGMTDKIDFEVLQKSLMEKEAKVQLLQEKKDYKLLVFISATDKPMHPTGVISTKEKVGQSEIEINLPLPKTFKRFSKKALMQIIVTMICDLKLK